MKYFLILCLLYSQSTSGEEDLVYSDRIETEEEINAAALKTNVDPQHQVEINAGDPTELRGIDRHKYAPYLYKDFGRRFVLQYPYIEKKDAVDVQAEASLDKTILQALNKNVLPEREEDSLRPVKAPPEVVLAIAKQSALLQAATPQNPVDELIQKDIIRSGKYWNALWKEDVLMPGTVLRSNRVPLAPKLESIRVKIMPGSKLHQLVSLSKRISPKLLYIITNKKTT